MVKHPGMYLWSSYRAMVGEVPSPPWLATDGLLSQFGSRRTDARRRYEKFVMGGVHGESIWSELRQQIYLGDEKFVDRMQRKAKIQGDELSIPRAQRRKPAPPLAQIVARYPNRDDAIVAAYSTGIYSYREIAEQLDLHLATVGRIVRSRMLQCEN